MKKFMIWFIALVFLSISSSVEAHGTVFTYRSAESSTDKRYEYDNAVLELALEKTREKWGDYILIPSPPMNSARALVALENGVYKNPMFKFSANTERCRRLSYASFPVDLGVVGCRVFFVSKEIDSKLSKVKSLDELKKFSIGQGRGWLDVKILSAAGFKVMSVANYESLFYMVAKERFDLFSRGINEVEDEHIFHKHIKNMMVNRVVGLYYPLPRFFYTNKGNVEAVRRINEGLIKAYNDGSLKLLWEQKYRSSLNYVGLGKIKFFEIDNPFLGGVDSSYMKFLLFNNRCNL